MTTQIDVSMAWVLWGAFLGELSMTGCSGNPDSCDTFGVTDGTMSQNCSVAGGVSLKVCDSMTVVVLFPVSGVCPII